MLAATIFAWFWIFLCSNKSNCVTFAVYVLLLVNPELSYNTVDDKSARFIGVVANTVACLLLYFTLRASFLLNTVFAAFKIAILTVFFIVGVAVARKTSSGLADFTKVHSGINAWDAIAAMTYITSTYEGWENTNYVSLN
jgi:hypothetical protein